MLIDIEQLKVTVQLTPREWKEVVAELRNLPEIRGLIIEQVSDALGDEYHGHLLGV